MNAVTNRHMLMGAQYRLRAEETRVLVECIKDQNAREILKKVAADYDRMADVQDKMGREKE